MPEGKILVDVQQIISLPEAVEYQITIREKRRKEVRVVTYRQDNERQVPESIWS